MQQRQKRQKQRQKNGGVSQRHRKNPAIGVKDKQISTGRRRLHADKNTGTRVTTHPFALVPFEKEIPSVDVLTLQNSDVELADIDEQLKLVEDLHAILTNLGGKISLQGKSPSLLAKQILLKIDQRQGYDEWQLKKDADGYLIEGHYQYSAGPCFISIEFLSKISRTHPKLHDFIMYALKLVNTYNGVPLLFDLCKHKKGYTGMHYEYLQDEYEQFDNEEEEDESENQRKKDIKNALEYYGPNGLVSSYSSRLENMNSSLRMFEKELKAFKPKDKFEILAEPFLSAALALAKTKRNMQDICVDPYGDGLSTPLDYMRIMWSWDESDRMYMTVCDFIDCAAQSIGSIGFTWPEKLTKKGCPNSKENIAAATKFTKFFEQGHYLSKQMEDLTRGMSENPLLPIQKKKNGRLIDIIV